MLLPAVLAVLGHRIDAWPLPRGSRRGSVGRGGTSRGHAVVRTAPRRPGRVRTGAGLWHQLAHFVMRRPWPVMLAVVTFLLVLGVPFLGARFALPDDRLCRGTARATRSR